MNYKAITWTEPENALSSRLKWLPTARIKESKQMNQQIKKWHWPLLFLSVLGISVSSLSDGMFVLHVASEDNKQKVSLKISYLLLISLSAKLPALRVNMWTVLMSQGDVVLQNEHVIETLTKVAICADKINSININQGRWVADAKLSFCKILWVSRQISEFSIILLLIKSFAFPLMDSIKFNVAQGKEGIIDFTSGSELLIAKAKNGHLSVVSIADVDMM